MATYTIVTGAAGFIGANLVRGLNKRGIDNVIAVDNLSHADKFKNLVGCNLSDYIDKNDFIERLQSGFFDGAVATLFHQGACSDTMGVDGRYMMENNYRYSQILLDWCLEQDVQFLYASSAAVYGGGQSSVQSDDDRVRHFVEASECEAPLNVYGYSKFLFDQIVRQRLAEGVASQVAGFRYFNVYGPYEAHKGRMASVALHNYNEFRADARVRLFEGSHGYDHGEQRRDFVYVDDVIDTNLFFLEHPAKSGIFNLGTGCAQSFNAVAAAVVNSCTGGNPRPLHELQAAGLIKYISFPEALRDKYQAYTRADLSRLRAAGYEGDFADVSEGISRYVAWLQQQGE